IRRVGCIRPSAPGGGARADAGHAGSPAPWTGRQPRGRSEPAPSVGGDLGAELGAYCRGTALAERGTDLVAGAIRGPTTRQGQAPDVSLPAPAIPGRAAGRHDPVRAGDCRTTGLRRN